MTTSATQAPTGSLRINDTAPNFTAETTEGKIDFHEWIGNGWAVLFSHPKDFTPVCTTELGYLAGLRDEFAKRNTKIIGLSIDPVSDHARWASDIEETQGHKLNYPLIGDPELRIAKLYGMLPTDAGETAQGRTPADNATVRTVFVIGPDKKIKLMLVYRETPSRDAGELEAGRRRDHRRGRLGRRSPSNLSAGLEGPEALPAHRPAAKVTIAGKIRAK